MSSYNKSGYNISNYNYDITTLNITYLYIQYNSSLYGKSNHAKIINLEFEYHGNLETDVDYSVINVDSVYNSNFNTQLNILKFINHDKAYQSTLNFEIDSGMFNLNSEYSSNFKSIAKPRKFMYITDKGNLQLNFNTKFSKLYTNELFNYESNLTVNIKNVEYLHNIKSDYELKLTTYAQYYKIMNIDIINDSMFYSELLKHNKYINLEEVNNSNLDIHSIIRKNIDTPLQEYFVNLYTIAMLYSVKFEEFEINVELLPDEEIIIDSNAYEVYKNNKSILHTHIGDWLFMERTIKQIDLNYTGNSDITTTVEYYKRWL